MQIHYNPKTDLLYISFDESGQKVLCKEHDEDISLDFDKNDKLVGIEIMNASKRLDLMLVLPIQYQHEPEAVVLQ